MDIAVQHGLVGVELPMRGGLDTQRGRERLAQEAKERGLVILLAGGPANEGSLRDLVVAAREASGMEAPVVRTTLSNVLCGERAKAEGGWGLVLARARAAIESCLPMAKDLGVRIALENHQDAASSELIELCEETDPEWVGVCLDTGNPLAVGEDPVEFARAVASHTMHVHLKDYRVHLAPNGLRLVRCAAGEGVIDFPAMLRELRTSRFPLTPGIEVAAQGERLIRIGERDWWEGLPGRTASEIAPVIGLALRHGRPESEEWRTLWERGASSEEVARDEIEVFERSVRCLANPSPSHRSRKEED
jgi:sugar phosphate isomerase/epimerase